MTATVVLASASRGRRSVLRAAGIDPLVLVAHVDEDALTAARPDAAPAELVEALAAAKADAVARRLELPDAVVIGCDSMLLCDGVLQGKPHTAGEATRRWLAQAGRRAELLTGHAVLGISGGRVVGRATGVSTTIVQFATPTRQEIDAYVASGEPLEVAGAFTIDGRGGWFVEAIDGDPSCVIGLSLPLTRRLLAELGIAVTDLWRAP